MPDHSFWELPYYSGSDLTKLATICNEPRQPLIEGLIYQNTATLFYADDGVGKSLLLFQAICQASLPLKVYGLLSCPKPIRTLWIQAERHPIELGERLDHFSEEFTPNMNNIVISDKFQGYNLKNDKHWPDVTKKIDTITNMVGAIDIIVIDPIYALVSGEVASDDCASAITRFSTLLQNRYKCSTVIIHHTNRGGRDKAGNRTEGDLYGNRFLSAHFSGIFKIRRRKGVSGSEFLQEKDSFSILSKGFKLDYDTESWLSTCDGDLLTQYDTLAQYLRSARTLKKEFTLEQIVDEKQVSHATIHRYKMRELKLGFIFTGKYLKRSKLYKSELQ